MLAYATLQYNVESTWPYKLARNPIMSTSSGTNLCKPQLPKPNPWPPCQLEKGFPAAHIPGAGVYHHQAANLSVSLSRPSSTSASCAAGQVHINVVGASLCATKVYAVGISPTIHTSTANLSTIWNMKFGVPRFVFEQLNSLLKTECICTRSLAFILFCEFYC